MRSAPTSPLSSRSNRSEWFRQSVLFWNSQAGRNDTVDNNDSKVKPSSPPSLSSSQVSFSSETSSSHERSTLNDSESSIIFDAAELLRQVEELENCFKKSNKQYGKKLDRTNDETDSPHMTLEFPNGSHIKNNPLYITATMENNRCKTLNNASKSSYNTPCGEVDNKVISKNIVCKAENISSEDRTMNNLSSRRERNLIDSIQSVQDTLLELSEEIHTSKHTHVEKHDRDANDVMRNLLSEIKPPDDIENTSFHDGISSSFNLDFNDLEDSSEFQLRSEVLLKQIDDLIKIEHESREAPVAQFPIHSKTKTAVKHQRERVDSGLHSTSSASTSPYPSPVTKRSVDHSYSTRSSDSGYNEKRRTAYSAKFETLKEFSDNVFHDDSDFSSDWSPISTLDSVASSTHRDRSNSLPRTNICKEKSPRERMSTGQTKDNSINNSHLYNESELHAIRKYLSLTSHHLDKENTKVDIAASLEELSLLPSIKESIDKQRRELNEQRLKQDEFLHQMGDMLLEIVTLKEDHSSVRTKQAKALALLKRQLDLVKKSHLKDHDDVINRVNSLHEKLNNSFNFSNEYLTDTSSPRLGSPQTTSVIFPQPTAHNYGQVIWKISDVMKRLTRIKAGLADSALVSQPFQTSEYGYKMNSWIYLNGRGKMVGKYISLYVCVLVGDYDAILPWPIRPTYKFTLIDQRSEVSKKHDHVKIRRVTDIAGRGANVIAQTGGIPRPNAGTKALIVGFDDFVAHEQLLERRYMADDVLFLKIEASVV